MSDTLPEREEQMVSANYCDHCNGRPHAPWCPNYKQVEQKRSPTDECAFVHRLVSGNVRCGALRQHHSQYTGHEFTEPQRSTSEHEPVPRGGGDGPERIRVNVRAGKDDWIGIAYSSNAGDPSTIHEYVSISQHQSLVAEREQWERGRKFLGDRLEAQAETVAKIVKERNQLRLALEIIRDSFWSEGEPFEERVEYLQQTAKDILETVQKGPSE